MMMAVVMVLMVMLMMVVAAAVAMAWIQVLHLKELLQRKKVKELLERTKMRMFHLHRPSLQTQEYQKLESQKEKRVMCEHLK